MKTLFTTFCLFSFLLVHSQSNNFETNFGIDIELDTSTSDTLWQIGPPQKTIFNSAFSVPNVLVTDTLNTYPASYSSSFKIDLSDYAISGFPNVQISWMQKTDMEEGVDGGIIEASYDDGMTWLNVLDDTIFRPLVVGQFDWDTLFNNQAGVTGTKDWSWMALCWGTYFGNIPTNISTLQIRFTFASDSIDTNQEGWMIDNFQFEGNIIGSTNKLSPARDILVFPNPTAQDIFIDLSEVKFGNATLEIFNLSGQRVLEKEIEVMGSQKRKVSVNNLPKGVYTLIVTSEDEFFRQEFVKIK
ncbi:MAG: T9SS type A sorting domain-containing protein [Saprospiraceae bacterium]